MMITTQTDLEIDDFRQKLLQSEVVVDLLSAVRRVDDSEKRHTLINAVAKLAPNGEWSLQPGTHEVTSYEKDGLRSRLLQIGLVKVISDLTGDDSAKRRFDVVVELACYGEQNFLPSEEFSNSPGNRKLSC